MIMKFHWALADELVLISLEIYLHMHFRETLPYFKWLAFIEILTVSGLRGDLIRVSTHLLRPAVPRWTLKLFITKTDSVACSYIHPFF